MTKILVFGRTGQVAQALIKSQPATCDAVFLDRKAADLSRPDTLAAIIANSGANAIVIAAAYTAVDKAETDSATAWQVNAMAPREIGVAAARLGIPVVHLSTDYVFDGTGEAPFGEDDICGPRNVYGASKRAGELALLDSHAQCHIFRTSWVYDEQGQNFLRTMLSLRDRAQLDIVADQFGRPTHSADIAAAIWQSLPSLLDGAPTGLFHFTGSGPYTSWHGFAAAIFGGSGPALNPVTTRDYPRPAQRPLNSRLDISKYTACFGAAPRDWRDALSQALQAME